MFSFFFFNLSNLKLWRKLNLLDYKALMLTYLDVSAYFRGIFKKVTENLKRCDNIQKW